MNFVEYEFLIYLGIIQAWALTSSKNFLSSLVWKLRKTYQFRRIGLL
jgi:hypothetical protein